MCGRSHLQKHRMSRVCGGCSDCVLHTQPRLPTATFAPAGGLPLPYVPKALDTWRRQLPTRLNTLRTVRRQAMGAGFWGLLTRLVGPADVVVLRDEGVGVDEEQLRFAAAQRHLEAALAVPPRIPRPQSHVQLLQKVEF